MPISLPHYGEKQVNMIHNGVMARFIPQQSTHPVRWLLQFGGWVVSLCICLGLFANSSTAVEPHTAPEFSRDIQPLLSDNCYQCHGPDEATREADLRLDTKQGIRDIVTSGSVDDNELLRRINSEDPDEVMPPPETGAVLTPRERKMLADWIAAGGQWQGHWAFEAPVRPPLPNVSRGSLAWARNPIDLFVAERLEQVGLHPSPLATPAKRLRRLSLDLTGLPPTPKQLDQFLASPTTANWVLTVERLLASPRYGERMAMDWLDAARYADTNGYQGDRERTMWPWRDWVIDAINRNLPFDQFTVWQLAGDLLPNATDEQKLATGFCRNHMINGEGGRIAEENRVEYIYDQIETLGTVWMGMTVQCCRCHDHKFDPIKQEEYFKLFAFFNQTPINGGGGDPQMAPNLTVPTDEQQARISGLEIDLQAVAAELTQLESSQDDGEFPAEVAGLLKKPATDRSSEQWQQFEQYFGERRPQLVSLAQKWRGIQRDLKQAQDEVPKVMVMADMPRDKYRASYILNKGLYNQRLDPVQAGTPSFLPPLNATEPDRRHIAEWLVDPQHPLTARVTVNRIWQTFFGVGIVKTSEDFGVQGDKPSHPQLLDWLASELISSGWDSKRIVQLIVESSTYQQNSNVTETLLELDPENRLLGRGPRLRMPAWMIRDHALAVSGILQGDMGGPSIKPYQPAGIWEEASFGNKKYQQSQGAELYRRSLYIYWRRIVGPTLFFDMSKRQTCSVRHGTTNTPLHALVTLNDTTYVEAARIMAARVIASRTSNRERMAFAFRLVTSRFPREDELDLLAKRLTQLSAYYADNANDARDLVSIGEHSVSEKQHPSELAAWTTVCLTLLNLDEALNK